MNITFSARHFDATEKLQKFAEQEVSKLSKYFNGKLKVDIVLAQNESFKSVELRVSLLGKILPSRVEGNDFYKIIPSAVEKVEKQIKSTKEKAFAR